MIQFHAWVMAGYIHCDRIFAYYPDHWNIISTGKMQFP